MPGEKRPAAEDQIAVAADFKAVIELKTAASSSKILAQQQRLIVVVRAANIAIDLLQTNDIRVLSLDRLLDPLEPISPVASANAFVDVVA